MTHGAEIVLRDDGGVEHRARITRDGVVTVGGAVVPVRRDPDGSLRVLGEDPGVAWAAAAGTTVWVFMAGRTYAFERGERSSRRPRTVTHHGPLTAPMPATVRRIAVEPGAVVGRGDVLLILEAMKMELPIKAPADARVVSINCTEGELVEAGATLVDLEDAPA